MMLSKTVIKLQEYTRKQLEKCNKIVLSRNSVAIAIPTLGLVCCVVSAGLIGIGLIVGVIVKCVRSSKNKEEEQKSKSIGNNATRQKIEQSEKKRETNRELTVQNNNLFKTIQNSQEIINLNSLNNNMKIGL